MSPLPFSPTHLRPRDHRNNHRGRTAAQTKALIIAVIFVAITVLSFLIYILLRVIRRRGHESPWFVPPPLRERWRRWSPGLGSYGPTPLPIPIDQPRPRTRRTRNPDGTPAAEGVNRQNSVRSIITLPEYRAVPAEGREQTIGREGERAGMDVVLEFPETEEEMEQRREEHMQTLYEIRLARQQARNSAQANAPGSRGTDNSAASATPPAEPQPSATPSSSSLLATLQAVSEREARLSKVAYAEIGVQRPDGSRVRPSMESPERPLLGSASAPGLLPAANRSGSSLLTYEGSPERRRSDEYFGMTGVRLVTSSTPLTQVETPEYDGADWGPPPEYSSPVEPRGRTGFPESRRESGRGRARESRVQELSERREGVPVLRLDTGTPVGSSRATSRARSRSTSRSRSPSPRLVNRVTARLLPPETEEVATPVREGGVGV